jgi:ribosomal protein S18 acetylase RimI-like enzyme
MGKVNLNKITLNSLKHDEIEQFIIIELQSFSKMMLSIYSNDLDAAFKIRKIEISDNLKTSQYYVAKLEEKIVGTIEMITLKSIRERKSSFKIYFRELGLFRAIKAYFFSSVKPFKMTDETIYLDTVAVKKEFRGKGVARKMLSLAEDKAKKMGKKVLTLWVAEENVPAYNLYKSFGFNKVVKKSSLILDKIFKYRNWIYMKFTKDSMVI